MQNPKLTQVQKFMKRYEGAMPLDAVVDSSSKKTNKGTGCSESNDAPSKSQIHDQIQKFAKPTPDGEFKIPLLKALYNMGGSATTKQVLEKMRLDLEGFLKPFDFLPVGYRGYKEKWKSNVCYARWGLVKEGLLRDDSPHGLWELSQKGKDYAETHFGPDGQD